MCSQPWHDVVILYMQSGRMTKVSQKCWPHPPLYQPRLTWRQFAVFAVVDGSPPIQYCGPVAVFPGVGTILLSSSQRHVVPSPSLFPESQKKPHSAVLTNFIRYVFTMYFLCTVSSDRILGPVGDDKLVSRTFHGGELKTIALAEIHCRCPIHLRVLGKVLLRVEGPVRGADKC